MILIFGGAYQGKLDYALENYNRKVEEVFDLRKITCKEEFKETWSKEIGSILKDKDIKVLYKIDEFVYALVKSGVEVRTVFEELRNDLQGKILICDDVSQGLVPMEPVDREFREALGRALLYLGKEADEVIRIFCGLGQKIK